MKLATLKNGTRDGKLVVVSRDLTHYVDASSIVPTLQAALDDWKKYKTELESLRALTYRACELYVGGQDVLELASMAKLKAGRLNRIIPDGCLQFWGGMGFTWENKVSRMFRDGRLGSIGGGADEVMMGIIAKTMGVAKRPARA